MKVLVTGRNGQLVRSLLERGAGTCIGLTAVGRPELDLESPDSIAQAIARAAPDVVINAAAYTAVDLAADEPDRAFRINAEAAGQIAAAARAVGARTIHISTDYVFDGGSAKPYREDDPPNPMSVYGRSKLEGEERVREQNADHLIVRTAWVYSPFGKNFVKTMMGLARDRDTVTVVSDQRGNPSSALDLADGLFAVVDHWAAGEETGLGETYHLAGNGAATWFEVAQHVFATCARLGLPYADARPISTAEWPTKAARPANSMLDCSKFAADFRFQMPDWRKSAAEVVERLALDREA